jgi:hypothetical protein
MAKKLPARSPKAGTPKDPFKVDFHKVLEEYAPGSSVADRPERADTPLLPHPGHVKHPPASPNHKVHARQKKV